jgi:pimeloyl-ACP methyl ester carboxylesterase
MALVKVANGVIDVIEKGSGPDLVLLHSLLLDRAAFDRIAPELSKKFRLHIVALPGFDGSSPSGDSMEAFADRIAELWPALKLGNGTALLGNGFGAMVALTIAIRHGGLINRLVLADCVARFSDPGRDAIRQMGDKAEQSGMGSIAEIAARRIYHDAYVNAHPEEVERRREALLRMNRDTFIRACRITQNLDLKPHLKDVRSRTLVVYGELDQATPPALNGEVAAAIGAKSVAIPNCGHCPPLERPDAFLDAVTPFLAA